MRLFSLSFACLFIAFGCSPNTAQAGNTAANASATNVSADLETTAGTDGTVEANAEQPVAGPLGVQKGNASAPITVVEYFSPTCGACQQFHQNLMPVIQAEYIDTGKVLFEYRDYPLNQIDLATYALARCTGTNDGYFGLIDDFFQNQAGIREAVAAGAGKVALETLAGRHGIEDASAFEACVADANIRDAIAKAADSGRDAGVTGTPTFLVNGTLHKYADLYSEQQLRAVFDAAISAAENATSDMGAE